MSRNISLTKNKSFKIMRKYEYDLLKQNPNKFSFSKSKYQLNIQYYGDKNSTFGVIKEQKYPIIALHPRYLHNFSVNRGASKSNLSPFQNQLLKIIFDNNNHKHNSPTSSETFQEIQLHKRPNCLYQNNSLISHKTNSSQTNNKPRKHISYVQTDNTNNNNAYINISEYNSNRNIFNQYKKQAPKVRKFKTLSEYFDVSNVNLKKVNVLKIKNADKDRKRDLVTPDRKKEINRNISYIRNRNRENLKDKSNKLGKKSFVGGMKNIRKKLLNYQIKDYHLSGKDSF